MSSEKPETKIKILEAVWKLLEDPNRQEARMSDIAKLAGVSRQALYLHFSTRAELLIATVHYIDRVKDVNARLEKSRKASSGTVRLEAFIDAWGNYIPEIYGVGRALLAVRDNDAAARAAWDDRMNAVRHGCDAAVQALKNDGVLSQKFSRTEATEILWTMLSVQNWEQLRGACNWSQRKYIEKMKFLTKSLLIVESE